MKSRRTLLYWARQQLAAMENPTLQAHMLLAHVLDCERIKLLTWPDELVQAEQEKQFKALIQRRMQHEPIAYLIGHKEFWSLDFKVTPHTLIPRPETELLIDIVLNHLPVAPQQIIDVGTGSGIIACALAHMRPMWQITATDLSSQALEVASFNAARLNLPNIHFINTNWCDGIAGPVDAIVSNPPYIASQDPHLQQGDLPYEPQSALVAGPTGLEAYQAIIQQAKRLLKARGLLAFEHGYNQAQSIQILMKEAGFEGVQCYQDLFGQPRVTIGFYTNMYS